MKNKLRIKLTKSTIGFAKQQKETIKSLGLTRINQVRELTETPQIRGMLFKVRHLVEITGEAVSSGAKVAQEQVSSKLEAIKDLKAQKSTATQKEATKQAVSETNQSTKTTEKVAEKIATNKTAPSSTKTAAQKESTK